MGYQIAALVVVVVGAVSATVFAVLYALKDVDVVDMGSGE